MKSLRLDRYVYATNDLSGGAFKEEAENQKPSDDNGSPVTRTALSDKCLPSHGCSNNSTKTPSINNVVWFRKIKNEKMAKLVLCCGHILHMQLLSRLSLEQHATRTQQTTQAFNKLYVSGDNSAEPLQCPRSPDKQELAANSPKDSLYDNRHWH